MTADDSMMGAGVGVYVSVEGGRGGGSSKG